jgi:hypothetical protein
MTVPVAVVPVPVAPVVAVPMAVAPVMVVPVVTPADFLRLEVIDFALRNHGGFDGLAPRRHKGLSRQDRRQRCGLRASRECGRACNKSNREF